MTFSRTDKQKALAIVRVFETGKAGGDYASVAVLDDGAGISYGVSQFTHRSGSLAAVTERYLATGSMVGRAVLADHLPLLRSRSAVAIKTAAANEQLKKALRAAAITSEMRTVQDESAEEFYLAPAISACEAMGFTEPLSLAVIHDSITHGSWEKIRAEVPFAVTPNGVDLARERLWITTYVRKRDAWLAAVKRLVPTRYRTRFFLSQIAISNWELRLPVIVNGTRLDDATIKRASCTAVCPITKLSPAGPLQISAQITPKASDRPRIEPSAKHARPANEKSSGGKVSDEVISRLESAVNSAAEKFDRVETIAENVITRTDAAKSLWTMVAGTIWQTLWGIAGFMAGLPRTIWLAVAVIAGALMLGYLYRQIALGKLREMKNNGV